MHAKVGDKIVVDATHTGDTPRECEVLEVLGQTGAVHYRVRWSDGHDSLFFPGSDAHIVQASRTQR